MAGVSQQIDFATTQGTVKPLVHQNFLQKVRDLLIGKGLDNADIDEEIRLQSLQESPISTAVWGTEVGFQWVTIKHQKFDYMLHNDKEPILVLFYTNKVPLTYHNTSNEQSKRCDKVCEAFETLAKNLGQGKVKFVKFDIEKSIHPLYISHIPTIKLYRRSSSEKIYSVEYFDDPLKEPNYKQFLKEEHVLGL